MPADRRMDLESPPPSSRAQVNLGKISQRTTHGTIASMLRRAILDGTLTPGSPLREAHIAADLGVSRAPLREALAVLADEGLVQKIPYRGAFVADVNDRAIAEIAEIRRRIEPFAIELALPALRGPARDVVERALRDMSEAATERDYARAVDAHMDFHRSFYELAAHGVLLSMWHGWESQLQLFLSRDHRSFHDLSEVVAEHERLLHVIDTEDIDAITTEVARHVHG